MQAAWTSYSQGNLSGAVSTLHRLAAGLPGNGACWHLLAVMFWQTNAALAERYLRRTLALDPLSVAALNALAATLMTNDRAAAARSPLRKALALAPADALTLGNFISHSARSSTEWAWRALHLQPSNSQLALDLHARFLVRGDVESAAKVLTQATSDSPAIHASRICVSYLQERATAKDTLALARDFDRRFARALPATRHNSRGRPKRLRIGYSLNDGFRLHTAALSMLPLVEGHDRTKVDVFCYSDVPTARRDSITDRFGAASTFRDLAGRDDAAFAAAIADDRIDVMIDTHGYARGSRVLAFARKPARVHVYWPPMGSMGLDAISVILGDRWTIPFGTEADFSERVVRIPFAFHYDPLLPTPEVAMPGTREVVFGSFNQLAKLSPRTTRLWSRILGAVPRSRLLLKAGGFTDLGAVDRIRSTFASAGIDPDRIECRSQTADFGGHLANYADVDIGLDPSPYGGVITTLEAMWMGVPVVTLIGDRLLGRYGHAFVSAVGLPELAAASEDAYVEAAVALAADQERRKSIRGSLRARMQASALCDIRALVANIESTVAGLLNEPQAARRS